MIDDKAVQTALERIRKAEVAAQDPLTHHVPTQSQEAYLRRSTPFSFATGANRSGKSMTMCFEMACLLCGDDTYRPYYFGGSYLAVAPTRKQAALIYHKFLAVESMVMGPPGQFGFLHKDMQDGSIKIEYVPNCKPKTPASIHNKRTGKTLYFAWSQAGMAEQSAQGMSYDAIWLTETGGTQRLIEELFPRILDVYSNKDKPGGGFLTWDVTETKMQAAMVEFRKKAQNPDLLEYGYYYLRADENPMISMADREKFAEGMSERAKRIRIYGTGTAQDDVLIYPGLTTDTARWQRKEPYVWLGHENMIVSYDAGVDHPTAILFSAINKFEPRKVRLLHAIETIRTTVHQDVEMIRTWLRGRRITSLVYDHQGAGKSEKGSGKSAVQYLYEALDDPELWQDEVTFVRGKSMRAHGINAVRQYLDPTPDFSDRPLLEFDPPTMDNGLAMWLAEMQSYRGREDLDFTGPKGVYNKQDDLCDCTRYLCAAEFCYFDHGSNTMTAPVYRPDVVEEANIDPMRPVSPEERRKKLSIQLFNEHNKRRLKKQRIVY